MRKVEADRKGRTGRGISSLVVASMALFAAPALAQSSQPPLIAQACVGCHGQAGAGRGSVPKIAGFGRAAFIAQWTAFRGSQRPATIMNRVATGYTDAEVAILADYFASLK